jgi:hypothetical protein
VGASLRITGLVVIDLLILINKRINRSFSFPLANIVLLQQNGNRSSSTELSLVRNHLIHVAGTMRLRG